MTSFIYDVKTVGRVVGSGGERKADIADERGSLAGGSGVKTEIYRGPQEKKKGVNTYEFPLVL